MTATIEPNIDIYGSLARASALADYLELLALAGGSCSHAELEDLIEDRHWTRKRRGLVLPAGADEDDEPESYVDAAFTCLQERGGVLGERYPFELDRRNRCVVRPRATVDDSKYVAILCLTAAHGWGLTVPHSPEEIFEESVADALESLNVSVARVSSISRGVGGDFRRTLDACSGPLGIKLVANAASRHRYANDAGADVLGHVRWGDERVGRWTLMGQVTCASSDSWKGKMNEPGVGLWAKLMGEPLDPVVFLAVPHHVEGPTWGLLVEESRRVIIDRLRVVLGSDSPSAEERAIAAAVRAYPVERAVA